MRRDRVHARPPRALRSCPIERWTDSKVLRSWRGLAVCVCARRRHPRGGFRARLRPHSTGTHMSTTVSRFAEPARSALELIGNTALLELTRLSAGRCRLFAKLESDNPGGSIKDRIGLSMIEAAEKNGKLRPGGTIVEATAGNTGLGLAQVGVLKGYRIVPVVPDKMAREKIQHLRALG